MTCPTKEQENHKLAELGQCDKSIINDDLKISTVRRNMDCTVLSKPLVPLIELFNFTR
jgi:hypothetical protein